MSKSSLDYFQMEAAERLERLSAGLMDLEQSPHDKTLIVDLFREAHSLKGAAGVSGLTDISNICHKMEDFLGGLRDGSREVSSVMIDACLAATDAVGRLVAATAAGEPCDLSVSSVLDRFDTSASEGEMEPLPAREEAVPAPAEVEDSTPAEVEEPPEDDKILTSQEHVPEKPDSEEKTAPKVADEQPAGSSHPTGAASDMVRLRVGMLDLLSYRTGELMIAGDRLVQRLAKANELQQLIRDELAHNESDHKVQEMLRRINTVVHRLTDDLANDQTAIESLIAEVHEQVLDTRMLPLSVLLDQLPRFVRDYCRDEAMEAELFIEGADIRVDRQVLEQLRDPLIHIIRNSLSHGLESSEVRQSQGKEPVGTIRLVTSRHGERIRIVCEDDGRGIDCEKVRAKAVAQGMVSETEAAALSDEEVYQFMFRPGFSTAETITDVSGRGVGMDVVLSRIESLRGTLEIESEPQQFTRIILEFPASVVTLEGLLVEAAGTIYVVPLVSVLCTARVPLAEVQTGAGNEALVDIEGEAVPLVILEELLGREGGGEAATEALPIVVIRHRNRRVALGVDRLLGTQTIVSKGLGDHLQGASGVAGASILGTGVPVLVLEPSQLIKNTGTKRFRHEIVESESAVAEEGKPAKLLVVDDSLTTRMMEKSILESAGYQVDTAADAEEALVKVKDDEYQLFVFDVEMPGLNGFQLTRKIREDERFSDTPIVIITTLATEENRREGLDAGANAYLVKKDFDQNNLVDTVERLVCK